MADDRTKHSLQEWEKLATKSLKSGSLDELTWHTPEGIDVKALYTRADIENLPHADTLPGIEPFVRGPQATMYAVRPWTIRQYACAHAESGDAKHATRADPSGRAC
jgi:methylmalonyl-CoA mutase